MSSLQVGKTLYQLLATDPNVSGKVGNKIFPLVADTKTTFPFIVYHRASVVSNNNTKDRILYQEIASMELRVLSDKYEESIEIAEKVRTAIENKTGLYGDLQIKGIDLVDADETFNEDTYIQTLIFNIKL